MNFFELVSKFGQSLDRKRGEYLFRQGDENRNFYLIHSGLLKAYYQAEDGKENIKSFLTEGDTIGSIKGFRGDNGCSFNLVCREDSRLTAIDFDEIQSQAKMDVELANEMIEFLLRFAMKKETREYELLCLEPEARYRRLLDIQPNLFERITQNEIALFLGVTPVGLSRIKKRVQSLTSAI